MALFTSTISILRWSLIVVALALLCPAMSHAQTGVTIQEEVPAASSRNLIIANPTCAPLSGFSLRLRFDTGQDFVKSALWTSSTVNVSASLAGVGPLINSTSLTINAAKPEVWYVATFTASNSATPWPAAGTDLTISATASAVTNSGASLPNGPRIIVECVPTYQAVFTNQNYLIASTVPVPVSSSSPSFEYIFSWDNSACNKLPSYQLQVLYSATQRLYNGITPEEWQEKALLVDTGSPLPTYTLTLADGVGFYYWRVRGIGNQSGGAANPANIGGWIAGATLQITSAIMPNANLNWIYSRTFSEGGRVAEKLTFANGLQQIRQTQTRLAGNSSNSSLTPLSGQQVVATQTVQDYAGRSVVQSLPIPILGTTSGLLGYKPDLLKKSAGTGSYEAADFDSDDAPSSTAPSTFNQPLQAVEQGYYSNSQAGGGTNSNDRVADAQGYPFTRTRFGPDGRVREQSGVGLAMSLAPESSASAAHTTRTYYAAVAQQELVRLFGDEAPEASGTFKVLSIDPNNTTSVSYQTKQGQTIATALSKANAASGPTEPLPSAASAGYSVTEELAGPATVVGKTLVVTEPNTSVTINYTLTPAVLQNSCLNYCASCDYKVRIRITKVNDPLFVQAPQEVLIPSQAVCSPTAQGLANPWTVSGLGIGEYRIEREISPVDPVAAIPSTDPPVPSIDARLATVQGLLDAMPNQEPWKHISELLQLANVDELYRYLLVDRGCIMTTINSAQYIQIPTLTPTSASCTSFINLPYLPDYCHPSCDLNDPKEFTKQLNERLGEINEAHNTSFAVDNILGEYSPETFFQMLRNMEEYGNIHPDMKLKYSCAELMACVNAQVASLETNLTVVGNSPTGYSYSFVKEFLACTGMAMTEPLDIQDQPLDITRAFAQFTYDSKDTHDKSCLTAAYACQLGINEPLEILKLDFDNQVKPALAGFADFKLECRVQAYNCLKNHTPVPAGQPNSPSSVVGIDEANKAAKELERTCYSTCNDRRAELRANVVEGFHRKGLTIADDPYYVNLVQSGFVFTANPINPTDPNLIETCEVDLIVQGVVEMCQSSCRISVQDPSGQGLYTIGTPQELDNMQKVMLNDYSLTITKTSEGCPADTYAETNGTQLLQAELTSCAEDVIRYLSALARGVPRLIATPPTPGPLGCNVPVGTISSAEDNIFTVVGPLRKQCTQTTCQNEPLRVNHWVTVVDSRSSNSTNRAFNPLYDYSLIWNDTGYGCPPSGEDAPGVLKVLPSQCMANATQSPYSDGPYYQLHFTDASGAPIAKDLIVDVSPPFLVEPSSAMSSSGTPALASGLTNLFTAEGIKVRLTLASGGWMIANLVASYYLQFGDSRSASALPTAQRGILQWKTTKSCGITNNQYKACIMLSQPQETVAGTGVPVFTGEPVPCNQILARQLQQQFSAAVGQWRQDQIADITQQYRSKCQALDGAQEHFTVTYSLGYHHFTLYYYDRAGNLLRTVPPKGVSLLANSAFLLSTGAAPNFKPRSQWGRPGHSLVTTYAYNSLHRLISQATPDGGNTQFYYNRKGQLRFSQNARQQKLFLYTYTKYDALGRTVEVGESSQDININTRVNPMARVLLQIEDITFPAKKRTQVTTTVYSDPAATVVYSAGSLTNSPYASSPQRNLTNRVSYAMLDIDGDPTTTQDNSNTYYSYDAHGNVEWLVQQQSDLGPKYLRYEYDLISNKVLRVNYQEGQADQFYHQYDYDGDNRLTQVSTSSDGVIWDKDARYTYYAHGPLKRLELGEDHVQGIDYTYTLQGWLKAINHPTTDPGHDGPSTNLSSTAKDVFSMSLGYFSGDYSTNPGSGANPSSWTTTGQLAPTQAQGLYNGNIATWTSWGDKTVGGIAPTQPAVVTGETYHYDELNRLLSTRTSLLTSGSFGAVADYATNYSYDANGNLLKLIRNTGAAAPTNGNVLDELEYHYDKPGTNQLTKVDDAVPASVTAGFDDIKPFAGATEFEYDEIGNLISDAGNNVANINWTVYGKIADVKKNDGTLTSFRYDAAGNRILKTLSTNNGAQVQLTYYVRDAQGNILATYNQQVNQQAVGAITLREHSIYGSSRLGVHTPTGSAALNPGYYARTVGEKQYELTDHLGNVRAVVSDAKLPDTGGNYRASLAAYSNYYAFGMLKPDGNTASTGTGAGAYRYGYNGKEQDNNGEFGLTSYDYGFRIYNPGLGKFLSVDPLTSSYPWLTSYQFAENTPIQALDLDGLEKLPYQVHMAMGAASGTPGVGLVSYAYDWITDWATSGMRMVGEGMKEESVNEVENRNNNHTQNIPKEVQELGYKVRKLQAQTKQVEGLAKHMEVSTTLMDLAMGGIQGTWGIAGRNAVTNTTANAASKGACFTASTIISTSLGGKSIVQIQVGDSVNPKQLAAQQQINEKTEDGVIAFSPILAKNKWAKIDFEEITPSTWKWIELELARGDGTLSKINLRRPNWWFKAVGADSIGEKIYLDMPEMGIVGFATVKKISANQLDTRFWNENRKGDYISRPITGKFEYESSDVYYLYFGDTSEPLSVTGSHPIWSIDRHNWVGARELKIGEKVKTQTGFTILKSRTKSNKTQKVYNLEIYKDHNFLVSTDKILVHNGCWDNFVKKLGSAVDNIAGEINLGWYDDETVHLSIDAILKNPKAQPHAAFKALTEAAEQTAKEAGLSRVEIDFNLVVNSKLRDYHEQWARLYGYHSTKHTDNLGSIVVTWEKTLK